MGLEIPMMGIEPVIFPLMGLKISMLGELNL